MNDKEKKSGDWRGIIGGIVLIVVLFAGIKLIFYGLEQVIPKQAADGAWSVSLTQDVPDGREEADAPSYCIHCGRSLPEGFQWGQYCPYCGEKVE